MTEKAELRIHRRRQGRPGDLPHDAYEVEKPQLTMAHTAVLAESLPCPPSIPREMEDEWESLTRSMAAMGLLSPLDSPILETAMLALHLQRQASRTLQMEGPTIYDARGQAVPHPAIGIIKNASKTVTECAKQLGWDPITRLKNPIPESPTTDPNDPARLLTSG